MITSSTKLVQERRAGKEGRKGGLYSHIKDPGKP